MNNHCFLFICWVFLLTSITSTSYGSESYTVRIDANDTEAIENMANSAQFEVKVEPVPSYPIRFDITLTGTATLGTDFNEFGTKISENLVRITVPSNGILPISINPIENTSDDGNKTITLTLSAVVDSSLPVEIGDSDSVTINIIDDETTEKPEYGSVVMIGFAQPNVATYEWKQSELQGCSGTYSDWESQSNWSWTGNCDDEDMKLFNRVCLFNQAGSKWRDVWCQRSDGANMGPNAAECNGSIRPAQTEVCTMSCSGNSPGTSGESCYVYAWNNDDWGACGGDFDTWSDWSNWTDCTELCDGGTTERTKTCLNDSKGTKTRNVWCEGTYHDGTIVQVDDSFCSLAGAKPDSSMACSNGCEGSDTEQTNCNTFPCETFSWKEGEWGTCQGYDTWSDWSDWTECNEDCDTGQQSQSRTCLNDSQGTQTRSVTCIRTHHTGTETTVADSECVNAGIGSKPVTSRNCSNGCEDPGTTENTRSCNTFSCYQYEWVEGAWGDCSGTSSSWSDWSDWEDCSVSCGTGTTRKTRTCLNNAAATQERTVSCLRKVWNPNSGEYESDLSVSDDFCTSTKPATSRICALGCVGPDEETQSCTIECYEYSWAWGDWGSCGGSYDEWNNWGGWSSCSASCGSGTQERYRSCKNDNRGTKTRNVYCKRVNINDGGTVAVDDSFCSGAGAKPSTSTSCSRGCSGSSSESRSCWERPCCRSWQGNSHRCDPYDNRTVFYGISNRGWCQNKCEELHASCCSYYANNPRIDCYVVFGGVGINPYTLSGRQASMCH